MLGLDLFKGSFKRILLRAGEMTQEGKVLAPRPGNTSSIPGPHTGKERSDSDKQNSDLYSGSTTREQKAANSHIFWWKWPLPHDGDTLWNAALIISTGTR